jgi:HMGL-like
MTEVRDVTLRDGLQLTRRTLPVARKVEVIRELLTLGIPHLEIGSLARPDLAPALSNTLEVVSSLDAEELERCWVWVATLRHVKQAIAAGARNIQYCLSVSDAHNRANLGRDTEASVAALPAATEAMLTAGGRIQFYRGASCSTATTPGARAWRTAWPQSTPAQSWSTAHSGDLVAARSRPVRAGIPPWRIFCSDSGPIGSSQPDWVRSSGSRNVSSSISTSRTGPARLRECGPR